MPALVLVMPTFASAVAVGLFAAHGSAPVKPTQAAVAQVAASGGFSATVPLVATTRTDGLPVALTPGRHRVSLPVWEASNGPRVSAVLSVVGAQAHDCASVLLRPGHVVRLSCHVDVPRGATRVVLDLRAGTLRVGRWPHPGT